MATYNQAISTTFEIKINIYRVLEIGINITIDLKGINVNQKKKAAKILS